MKKAFNKSIDEFISDGIDIKKGLSDKQADKIRETSGENKLSEKKKKSVFAVFLSQFYDLLVIILIVAAIVSIAIGNVDSSIVIFAVIILNAILGTVQHQKAQKSLNSLKKLTAPTAKVIRNNVKKTIDASQVVVGDILILEAGDLVVADGRIIESHSLQINESTLTGEALSSEKNIDVIENENVALGDMSNMVFSSTLVTYGRGIILVTAIGMDTELGKIAELLNDTSEHKTPLQVSLDNFSKKLSFIILIICAVIFGINILRKVELMESLMFAVALAVAAIPEALSSIVTITLAIGTSKMVKENAIIKNLKAVEGLGCVSVICSDKTGTLTQNKMTVKKLFSFGEDVTARLLLSSILCNDTIVSGDDLGGDPTETALTAYYILNNHDYNDQMKSYKRIGELPFDSQRKLMSTVHKVDGALTMFTKGAVDVLIKKISYINDNGTIREAKKEDLDKILLENQNFSEKGLRVLAFAQKNVDSCDITFGDEDNYVFLGLIAMIDPPREESKKAVHNCLKAGIKPIMITGDHKITACAIAKEIGIFKDGDIVLIGKEIDDKSDEELLKILPKISVYARVSPENKIRIVKLWQSQGEIVAMTGDGVNDAPALKSADIGIAMGITGTDVSKDAASMVLTDDNFATIVKSVINGRNIYNNIKNSIKFLLSGNTAGILAVVYTSIFSLPIPFAAVHLLFINLLTDSLPALAISAEKSHSDLIKEQPRNSKESILTKEFVIDFAWQGCIIAIFTLVSFYMGLKESPAVASTMAFSTLCLARLWHGFNCRGKQSVFKIGLLDNIYTVGAFFVGVVLLSCVLFIQPLHNMFEIATLSTQNLLFILLFSFLPTFIIQLKRVFFDDRK